MTEIVERDHVETGITWLVLVKRDKRKMGRIGSEPEVFTDNSWLSHIFRSACP